MKNKLQIMSNSKEFKIYYYNITTLGEPPRIDDFKANLSIPHKELCITQEIDTDTFFIKFSKEYHTQVSLKKGKKDDIESREPLELKEDESLFTDVFTFVNFKDTNLYSNSLWIVWVMKPDQPMWAKMLAKYLEEAFWSEKALVANPLTIKNRDRYIEAVEKIESFEFSTAAVNTQRPLSWSTEEINNLNKALDLKDWFEWDNITIKIWAEDGVAKNKVVQFFERFQNNLTKPLKVTIDEAWNHVDQQLDKIRIMGIVSIDLSDWDLPTEAVLTTMQQDMNLRIEQIQSDLRV